MEVVKILEYMGYANITDFEVYDDGSGQYIHDWHHADPEPDNTVLTTNETAMLAQESIDELPNEKLKGIRTIDVHAELARSRYITTGSGQSMTYQVKGEEAANYIADGYPADLSAYPFIQAEVNATGKTATAAADDIIAQRDVWKTIGAAVEEARISGKVAVNLESDVAGVIAATNTAVTALDLI